MYTCKLLSSSYVHVGNNSQGNKLRIILISTLVPVAVLVVLILVVTLVTILLCKRFRNKDYRHIPGM